MPIMLGHTRGCGKTPLLPIRVLVVVTTDNGHGKNRVPCQRHFVSSRLSILQLYLVSSRRRNETTPGRIGLDETGRPHGHAGRVESTGAKHVVHEWILRLPPSICCAAFLKKVQRLLDTLRILFDYSKLRFGILMLERRPSLLPRT